MAQQLKEDVYETEDVPIAEEVISNGEPFEDLGIERSHVDVEGALTRFGRRLLNADAAGTSIVSSFYPLPIDIDYTFVQISPTQQRTGEGRSVAATAEDTTCSRLSV